MAWTEIATLQGPPGAPGAPGLPGDKGNAWGTWQNTWAADRTYQVSDLVVYNNKLCISKIADNAGNTPGNNVYWGVVLDGNLAPAGQTGPPGAPGVDVGVAEQVLTFTYDGTLTAPITGRGRASLPWNFIVVDASITAGTRPASGIVQADVLVSDGAGNFTSVYGTSTKPYVTSSPGGAFFPTNDATVYGGGTSGPIDQLRVDIIEVDASCADLTITVRVRQAS